MAAASAIWHQPRATRGRAVDAQPAIEPAALPIPKPTRKTARMMENV